MPKPKFPNVHEVYLGFQESLPKLPKVVKKGIFSYSEERGDKVV